MRAFRAMKRIFDSIQTAPRKKQRKTRKKPGGIHSLERMITTMSDTLNIGHDKLLIRI
jgi:hypothetical protein